MRKVVAAAVLGVIVLGACGSSKSTNTSASGSTTTVGSSGTTASASASVSASGKFCDFNQSSKAVQSALSAASGDLKTNLEKASANIDAAVAASPSEIRADFQLYANDFLKPLIAAYQKANYDPTKVDYTAITRLATDAKLKAAGDHITAYYQAHCPGS
jgi:hypothetical protein